MQYKACVAATSAALLAAIAFGTPGDRRVQHRPVPPPRVQKAESPDDLLRGRATGGAASRPAVAAALRRTGKSEQRRADARSPLPAVDKRPDEAAPVTLPRGAQMSSAVEQTPDEVAAAREIGARLLERARTGSVQLVRQDREPLQLEQLAAQGCCVGPDVQPVVLAPALLRTLDRLSEHSSPDRPLVLLSLYRPLSEGRPREPHGNGLAVDISAYGGHRIDSRDADECVAGVLAVVKALAPGDYRLGLPKPPGTDPAALMPPPPRPADWPFFPAPLPEMIEPLGIVAPRVVDGRATLSSRGAIRPFVSRWENERYAPLADVGSPRVRAAIEAAIARGANIHSLFPDALDHLHLDVKPEP